MMQERVLGPVSGVCPVCLKKIEGLKLRVGDDVYIQKACPEHGSFRVLIWEGSPDYEEWGSARDGGGGEPPGSGDCPYDCGLCAEHRRSTCCALLEVTGRCDLGCPVCYADSSKTGDDPSLGEIGKLYDGLLAAAGRANIQLSGGEPTMRGDLPEIIRMGREKGFVFFQLNTNGLRLAAEPDYARVLKEAGLSCVFLQFDGVTEGPYIKLRGRPLLQEKLRALDNCAAAGLGVVLVPVLAPEVNLSEVGDIVRLMLERLPAVRGVHFQPISYFGRCAAAPERRLTLPRVLRELEAQTNGMFPITAFSGGSAENPYCSFSGSFLLRGDKTVQPLKTSGSCCCAGDEVSRERDMVARRWGADMSMDEPEAAPGSLDELLQRARRYTFSVSAMGFQDAWTLDLERLRECYIHIPAPDGRLIPFCAYNLTSSNGETLYRGKNNNRRNDADGRAAGDAP